MNINQLKESKYLKKEDVEPPVVVTISDCTEVNVGKEGGKEDMRFALHFEELDKPMILNTTNGQLIARITGTEAYNDSPDQSDRWIGHRIVLYHEPNVSYGGKLVGGIRVRAPKINSPKKAGSSAALETAPQVGDPDYGPDDEIPF